MILNYSTDLISLEEQIKKSLISIKNANAGGTPQNIDKEKNDFTKDFLNNPFPKC